MHCVTKVSAPDRSIMPGAFGNRFTAHVRVDRLKSLNLAPKPHVSKHKTCKAIVYFGLWLVQVLALLNVFVYSYSSRLLSNRKSTGTPKKSEKQPFVSGVK
eukprot:2308858-Amphidinium_carterae.1